MTTDPSTTQDKSFLIWVQLFKVTPDKSYSLCKAEDLSNFGWFEQKVVREHLVFASRTSTKRVQLGSRTSIPLKEVPVTLHIYKRTDNLAGCCVASNNYPERVAHTLITKVLKEFTEEHKTLGKITGDQDINFDLGKFLKEYQNPNNDKLRKIQNDLDSIKDIMHKNIEDLLERGVKLDDLAKKSEDISIYAHTMREAAARNNKYCCSWI